MVAGLVALPGCAAGERPGTLLVAATWTRPPSTGTIAVASIRLTAVPNTPVTGARLDAQGFMSHPGMAPVTAAVEERGGGLYDARFQFTMAGDWIVRVTGTTPDGHRIDQQLAITTVHAAQER